MCFYLHLSAHRRSTQLIPECERLPDIATKRRQHIIIAIWNVTTVLHAWGTGIWHIVTLGRCFQLKTSLRSRTGNKIHCPVCPMTVFIVNGFFVTEKSVETLWLRDVVHLSCSHSSSSALPRPRQWQEVCGPRLCASFLSPSNQPARMSARHLWPAWRRRQAKSSSCTQTQPFSHQCVSGRQRREAHCARWLVRTRSLPRRQACTQYNHFGWSTAEWVRTPAVGSALHISLQQHFFFLLLCD